MYDVLVNGKSYGIMDNSNIAVDMKIQTDTFGFLGGHFSVPSRQEKALEFNIPFMHPLQLFFMEKQSEIYSTGVATLNYKFDVTLHVYERLEDHYTFDFGDILMREDNLKGCFVEELNFDEQKCKAKLLFDFFETTNYF